MYNLDNFIENRDEAMIAYSLTGEAVDKARYNRSVKMLRDYVQSNEIQMEEKDIDILLYESKGLNKVHDEFKFDDSDLDDNVYEDVL